MDIKSFLKKIRNAFKRITTPVARKLISVVERILVQNGLLKKFGILNWRIPYGIARKTVITISANRSLYTYYLQGTGIEIGALHGPLRILHNNAKVKYVDYTSTTDLKKRYPNLDHIVNVDIISSAEDLEGTEDDSLCFIIANHVIEHIANPIKTLERWHKKLKNEGILYLAFPDAMRCPDKVKRINSLSHHVKDYLSDTKEANDEHLLGFVYAWNPNYFKDPDEIGRVLSYMWEKKLDYIDGKAEKMLIHNQDCVESLISNRNIEAHQHFFNYQSMKDLFLHVYNSYGSKYKPIDLSMTKHVSNEYIFILRKVSRCDGPFMDEFAKSSEEKEKLLEAFIKENAELIEEQRNILDQRYEIIQEQRKILDQRYEMIQKLTKAMAERHPTS